MLRFERYWWAALDHEFTASGFCDDESYDRLPPLPEHMFSGNFGWLVGGAAGADACYMEPGPISRPALYAVERRLARSGLALPTSFITFMTSAELQRSIPSCTSNGWRISPLTPSPVEEHGFLLRFMHDQQGCAFFYLYLAADGSCPVLGSIDLFTPEDEKDDNLELAPQDFAASATWMAPDFEQFIYRYWVENVIWHHVVNQERPMADLPLPAQEYVQLLRTPDRPALDVWPTPLQWSSDNPDQLKLW
ncbi:hypothetical protein [Actinoplanes regularis]|uniref:Uncharacterized protein n=1 Tax=Actinoplanes regularis TaxID=52697 RepID=A0A239IRT4_9ACTN|nr:hypothetical protein [Actinoplanes regularis]SNS95928.1 hypothetical protein SAMN06264365_13070 [Actinoplanes regularis]